MIVLYILLGVFGFLLILFFAGLYLFYRSLFYTPAKGQNDDFKLYDAQQYVGIEDQIYELIKGIQQVPYEDIYTTSYDGLKLHGRLYKNDKSDKVMICFHGYRGTAYRDFSGGATELVNLGFNVILIDERGHGQSEGHSITFGKKEQKDVPVWINKAKEIFGEDKEIILIGISMGASTILFAADKIDDNIKLVADSPYSTIEEIIGDGIKKFKLPVKLFFGIINLSSIIFGHANLKGQDASKSVNNSNHKVLIFHGDNDSVVNYHFSERVYLENKEKVQYALFPNAEHGLSYIVDRDRYVKTLLNFIK